MRTLSILLMSAISIGALAAPVEIDNIPGKLKIHLSHLDASDTEVKICGNMDIRDLQALMECDQLKTVDMGDANITEYVSAVPLYMKMTWFEADIIPQYLFMGSGIENLVLPNTLMEIGEGAFAASALTEVSGGAKVNEIGEFAFRDCKNLREMEFGGNVNTIGTMAFAGCEALESANLSKTKITEIPERCFAGCTNLTTILFPGNALKIGAEAFAGSGLVAISGLKVNAIEDFALANMPQLQSAQVQGNVEATGLFFGDGKLTTVGISLPANLPDYYFGADVNLGLEQITSNLSAIGNLSLAGISGTEYIFLGENLASVGKEAFYGMSKLNTIFAKKLEKNVPVTDPDAFKGLDQANIELEVTDVEFWEGVPEWNKFKVVLNATNDVAAAETATGVSVDFHNGVLSVASADNIKSVDVYDVNGSLLLTARPDSPNYSAEVTNAPNSGVMVVRIVTDSTDKTVKFLL